MQFSVGLGFNGTAECAAASSFPGIRVMSIYDNVSATPREYIYPTYLLPWSRPSATTVCGGGWGYFSAICYYTFRGVYEELGVPQGLIATSFGGSRLEEWMSPAALAVCPINATLPPAPLQSGIWNVMLTPFTLGPMAVRTNLWYQGEGNVACALTRTTLHAPAALPATRL
jgi:sialate O-acetylesterase